jgi:aquaporin Z
MLNKYLVEFFGTLFFVYIILATGNAIAIGAALAIVIMVGGSISGGNFNPAVSVAMVAAGRLSSSELLPYILAQVGGGFIALELFKRVKL